MGITNPKEFRRALKSIGFTCVPKSKHEVWTYPSSNEKITLSYGTKMSDSAIQGARSALKRIFKNEKPPITFLFSY